MSLDLLHNRIDLVHIPFTDRGSRLMLFRHDHQLFVRLAERWQKWENEVGHYRRRPPIVTDFTFLSPQNEPLESIETDTYPHCARIQTAVGNFDWTFLDPETLLIRLPAGRFGMMFLAYAEQAQADYRGGAMRGKRNIAYTTNARLLENSLERRNDDYFQVRLMLEAEAGDALLLNITPRLGYNRSIPNPDQAIATSRHQWQTWFGAAPPVLDEYREQYLYAWWIMRSGLVNTRYFFTREALLPSKIHYVGVWHWDQVFHALAYRHVDTRLAEDQLRIVLDHQRADGMLPDAIHDEGLVTHLEKPVNADVTKPPIMTWAILKLYETSQHRDFLYEVYDPLTRWNAWWMNANRNGNGLCEYRHPFSSGLDDNPLWDEGMPVVAPDLNTYLVLQNESLGKIARLIGEEAAAERYERQAEELASRLIEHLWDEQAGLFRALHSGQPIPTVTPFNLLPLLTGRLPEPLVERLIANLTNPDLFWTPYPIATVAVSDARFDPQQMWRGPVWININYFLVEALKRSGRHDLAAALRRKTLELVMRHRDIYEYYNPLTGDHPPKAAPMFGWSAALFIEMAIEETNRTNA
ncbi:MAG: hypothetical protein HZC41_14025 [Chloroflexi bacterium]|nr:hypothetical protein [Chloroflexota bacterium]